MTTNESTLNNNSKLTIIYRIEPGCLGPNGKDYIEDFCHSTQNDFAKLANDFILWSIIPRYDKSLPEIQYKIGDKNLPVDMASIYFRKYQIELSRFEELLNQKLADLIERHLGR
jgi:hypothetical protein